MDEALQVYPTFGIQTVAGPPLLAYLHHTLHVVTVGDGMMHSHSQLCYITIAYLQFGRNNGL